MPPYRYDDHNGGYRSPPPPPPSDYQRDGRMYDDDHYPRHDEGRSRHTLPHEDFSRDQRWHPRDAGHRPNEFQIRGRAASPDGYGRRSYRDRDREGYVSPDRRFRDSSREQYGGRQRSYSNERRPRSPDFGAPPSREVMLDGIPFDLGENDVLDELEAQYRVTGLKDVRVIRDRATKRSRGFGFIRFATIEEAQGFLEQNHPYLHLHSRNRHSEDPPFKVHIAFSREREDRQRPPEIENEWNCGQCTTLNFAGRKVCFKCQAPPSEPWTYDDAQEQQQQYLGSGDSDAAMQGPPSQFLLIRGLEPNVTEDLLLKGVSKLLKPGADTQDTSKGTKKGKIASTTGDANLGAKEGSIRRVFLVRDRESDESWRYGFAEFSNTEESNAALLRFNSYDRFTISSKPVTVTFIHTGVFVPVFRADEERFSFAPLVNPTLKLRYWNEHAYVSELAASLHEYESTATAANHEKPSIDAAALAASKEGLLPKKEDADAKAKKRKAEAKEKDQDKSKKTTPAHLQFWSNRHAELHGIKQKDSDNENNAETSKNTSIRTEGASVPAPPATSYADLNKNCCYLCSRQFKSNAEVNKHERLSKLHQDNLKNEDLRNKALAKLEKAGISAGSVTAENQSSEYRDRAKERRMAFGPSKKISLPLKNQDDDDKDTVRNDDSNPEESSGPPGKSKGAALLGKMGWTSGEGLGAKGEGTTEAIATNVYATGVGLGAEGSKLGDAIEEASRNSRSDYKEFLRKTKDRAKERFESM